MKRLLLYIPLLLCFSASSQEYNYIHYDTRDGLAGSTVYHMCQDKKGYIWFATDNGVSRFDGKTFKNFTTEDGLTDNEVLFISADSKGRIWMMPFNKTVCYYYEGKIYNSTNDTLLKNVSFSSYGISAGENDKGEVYFVTTNGISLYKNDGHIQLIADFENLAKRYSLNTALFVPVNLWNHRAHTMVLYNAQSVFVQQGDSFVYQKEINTKLPISDLFYKISDSLEPIYPSPARIKAVNSVNHISDSLSICNTIDGAWMIYTNGYIEPTPFLPGKKITNSLRDDEGNLWFVTIGEGVYRLTSQSMKSFSKNVEVFCIGKSNGNIQAGFSDGTLQTFKNRQLINKRTFQLFVYPLTFKRLYTMKSDSWGNLYLGFDYCLARVDKDGKVNLSQARPVKSIDIIDKDYVVICTNYHTLKVRVSDMKGTDTIWGERGTKVIYDNGTYYIGTLNGLVVIDSARNVIKTSEIIPLLSKRVVDMCKVPNGGIWVATNDNGVLLYRNGKVDTVINMKNGLSSNICRSLFLKDNHLWVGTNKGLNKIDINTYKVLVKYSTSDGLASDIINAVYSEDSITWVGSPAGLTYFSEKDISDSSVCNLDLYSVHVSGKKIDSTNNLQLSYKDNNITFDYTAVSFKSAGEILYKYKLTGLDNEWKDTRLTTLTYPSLPPGNYELQIYAINKFGKQSQTASIEFTIATPFWKTIWFWIILSGFVLGMTWYLLNLRYNRMQSRMREKNNVVTRMAELEQASLRAQMNPHFIFNCLNSIQHFILKKDIEQTNRYIIQFGNLIRQTLDNSAKVNISIADEINYLTSYLELEQMRFSSRFQYTIILDPGIHEDYTFIPSMLLQPFVENAIRHGIRYMKEGHGFIKISIRQTPTRVLFSIEDNGIGRAAAEKFKSEQHIEYQSKGITLAKNRLEVLSSGGAEKITTEIIDLANSNGEAAGTRVVITFPRSIIDKLS